MKKPDTVVPALQMVGRQELSGSALYPLDPRAHTPKIAKFRIHKYKESQHHKAENIKDNLVVLNSSTRLMAFHQSA